MYAPPLSHPSSTYTHQALQHPLVLQAMTQLDDKRKQEAETFSAAHKVLLLVFFFDISLTLIGFKGTPAKIATGEYTVKSRCTKADTTDGGITGRRFNFT